MPSAVAPSRPPPIYFIGHAGVSLLFDESPKNHIVQDNLRAVGKEIRELSPRPKAIITFSGHFEAGEIHGPGVIEGEICLVLFRKIQAIADTFTLAAVNVKRGTYIQARARLLTISGFMSKLTLRLE